MPDPPLLICLKVTQEYKRKQRWDICFYERITCMHKYLNLRHRIDAWSKTSMTMCMMIFRQKNGGKRLLSEDYWTLTYCISSYDVATKFVVHSGERCPLKVNYKINLNSTPLKYSTLIHSRIVCRGIRQH